MKSAIRRQSVYCKRQHWSLKISRAINIAGSERGDRFWECCCTLTAQSINGLAMRFFDLIVILDDATSEIYYAQLVEAESTKSVLTGIGRVVEEKGIFCALYSDRASHFFLTPKAGEPVDKQALIQVGRALRELGIRLIPAYSPHARGRSERSFRTWQRRLPQELRVRAIAKLEEANQFLRDVYIKEFNARFTVEAEEAGTALMPCLRADLRAYLFNSIGESRRPR